MNNKDKLSETLISYIASQIYSHGAELVAPILFACLHTVVDIANNSDNQEFIVYLKDSCIKIINLLPEEIFIAEEEDIN